MSVQRHLVFVVLFCAAGAASAFCPPPGYTAHYLVGDKSTDSQCNSNTIQEAIDAASNCSQQVVIDITREHLYGSGGFCAPSQSGGCHLSIANKNIVLQGWGDGVTCQALKTSVCLDCGPGQTVPLVTLDGASSGGPVLSISGTSYVTVNNLTLSHGNAGSGNGGGIAYSGSNWLTLSATTLNFNIAANGAGIDFNGTGSSAAGLMLSANTLILSNTANGSGGGIRVEGNARLFALQPQTLIGYNHAPNGYGGGLQVVGPALADIGSSGYGAGGVIFGNDAAYGGGIALSAVNDSEVRLFSTDPHKPVRISQNTASNIGGAIYIKPTLNASSGGQAVLCAADFRLDGNAAQEGPAIYGDSDYNFAGAVYGSDVVLGSLQFIDSSPTCAFFAPESAASLGAVACATGVHCKEIDGNLAQDVTAVPKPGSTLLIQNTGLLSSDALELRANSGASAVRAFDASIDLSNCLVVDGRYSGPLFTFENQGNPGSSTLQNCTIANNSIGSGDVIASGYGLTLHASIIAQPGVASLDYTGNASDLHIQYVMSNNISTLPGGNDVVVGVPTFVDAANGDYHLAKNSYGLDFAPAIAGDDRDLDGLPHDQDLPSLANVYGPRDLGAYERQNLFNECGTIDSIFCDGFGP